MMAIKRLVLFLVFSLALKRLTLFQVLSMEFDLTWISTKKLTESILGGKAVFNSVLVCRCNSVALDLRRPVFLRLRCPSFDFFCPLL